MKCVPWYKRKFLARKVVPWPEALTRWPETMCDYSAEELARAGEWERKDVARAEALAERAREREVA